VSRLEFKKKDQAQKQVEGLYKDLQRRIIASPPEQCPVDMTGSFLKLCEAQSCGKCVPCRVGVGQMINIIDDILNLSVESSMLSRLDALYQKRISFLCSEPVNGQVAAADVRRSRKNIYG
jgi:NADH:ubiquinone oxidoreductase, NADH-binding (51 kD) subunit